MSFLGISTDMFVLSIGGFIQTGIHESMDGIRGMSGWRWLFISIAPSIMPTEEYEPRLTTNCL